MKILGIEIERKTDILAFAAFLLAVGGISLQILYFFRGPNVELFPPEQLQIICYNYADDGLEERCHDESYVRFANRMAYVNSAPTEFSAVIEKEFLEFTLGDTRYRQYWVAFGPFDSQGRKLIHRFESDAHPLPVPGGGAISHETFFASRTILCREGGDQCNMAQDYITFPQLRDEIVTNKKLTVTFYADLFGKSFFSGKESLQASCTIVVNSAVLINLIQTGWTAPRCWRGDELEE